MVMNVLVVDQAAQAYDIYGSTEADARGYT